MPDILHSVFEQLTPSLHLSPAVEPYPYQLAVAEALLSGRRLVVRAPSGSGKSLAAWLPWLVGRAQPHDFPQQMLHILPGNAFYGDVERTLSALTAALPATRVSVQTEADAFDPFFLANAVITTVEQILSIALHRPLGLHPSLSNINGGVLLGSYLVCDEFPALASPDSLALWLGLLRRYYPTAPCLFTTTVLPQPIVRGIAAALDAEYLDMSAFAVGGRRSWSRMPALSADSLLRQHQQRTIVVCNTVRGAQTLYRALAQAMGHDGRPIELLLLHQYQLHHDRTAIEARAARLFAPESDHNALLVTTSGIKVGCDLSADTLISDPASPDKLLLRAGRCARRAGEQGRVIVAPVTDIAPSDVYPMPPDDALVNLLDDGAEYSAVDELAAYDALWFQTPADALPDLLHHFPTPDELDCLADTAVNGGAAGRHALCLNRVGACLHRVPETVRDPFALERFSLAIPSLERGWRQWQASGCPGEWFALVPHWSPDGQQTPFWSLVNDPHEFHSAARLVVLNSEAVSYDPVIGLELAPGTSYQSERLAAQHTSWFPFDQNVQRYEEHAARTMDAFTQLFSWYRFVLRHLGNRWRMPYIELEQWLRVSILWHDAGKLTAHWQRAASAWQTETMRRPAQRGVLARIDFQAQRDHNFPCPPHARAGAHVLSRALSVLVNGKPALLQGTLAALSQHHGLIPGDEVDLTPHPEAWSTLIDLASPLLDAQQYRRIDHVGWTLHSREAATSLAKPPTDPNAWMAFSLLVRAIRLSDREVALSEMIL